MVQAGLLTTHPGSVHGDGEAPGGGSSLRQGAGTGSPGSPDLETAATAKQRRVLEKGFCPEGFWRGAGGKYRRKGTVRDHQGVRAPGLLMGPLWLPLDDSGSFRCADFLYIFPRIYWA